MSRTTSMRKMNNMAEASDLLDEAKKGSSQPPANQADSSRDHRIVCLLASIRNILKNIASARQDDKQPAVACGNIKEDTSKMRGRKQIVGRKPVSKTPALEVPTDEEEEEEIEGEEDDNSEVESGEDIDDDDDDDDEDPNAVKTGQFLIKKSDMKRLENYPIWRMKKRPTMLRMFEMIVQDGAVRHKYSYTYSSYTHAMLDQYEKIQVNQISSQDGETIVEISQDCVPKPQDLSSLEDKHSSDQLLSAYIIYVDALFHQAVDSSFLRKINMDNDFQHYVNAINYVDIIIRDQISNIETDVSMKDEFKSRVRNCPMISSTHRQNWSETDQATTNKSSEKGVCLAFIHGYGYDPFFMEEDRSKGDKHAQGIVIGSTLEKYLVAYHGLMHFKYTLLKRCQYKVKLTNALEPGEDAYVLEKCLEDRTWILQTFDDLKNLLANENLIW